METLLGLIHRNDPHGVNREEPRRGPVAHLTEVKKWKCAPVSCAHREVSRRSGSSPFHAVDQRAIRLVETIAVGIGQRRAQRQGVGGRSGLVDPALKVHHGLVASLELRSLLEHGERQNLAMDGLLPVQPGKHDGSPFLLQLQIRRLRHDARMPTARLPLEKNPID